MSDTQQTEPADGDGDPSAETTEAPADLPADGPSRPAKDRPARLRARARRAAEEEDASAGGGNDEGDAADEDEVPLLPVGNPVRPLRGGIPLLVGSFVAFCLMAVGPQLRLGVPLGALAILIATFGALDLAGTFDDPDDRIAGRVTLAALARPLGLFVGGAFSLWGILCLAVDGRLSSSFPVIAAGVLVPASFLLTVVGAYRVCEALGVWSTSDGTEPRPLLRRHGFWLVTLATLLYLPILGSHSLSDPWETHYGEVSREILARNDWISTWWAQDGWFWSKPVLDFWIQALAMATFGVHYKSDTVLSAASEGRVPWPEWAVRLPVFLLTLTAVYLLYKAVARVFGRRAGLLGGVVLLTMPQWFLLSHQTMTDMPFVAPMASAMALFMLGTSEDPDEEVRVYELSLGPVSLRLSGVHLALGAVVACALPQILYLFSRNVSLDMRGFHAQLDSFMSGSPGNCTVPGNEACHTVAPVVRGLHPALQALIWAQAVALVVYLNWGERRRQRLYFLGAWCFAAVSTMAKGPAGVLLPGLCLAGYVVLSSHWQRRLHLQGVRFWRLRALTMLEAPSGFLILLAVALPWFVAMYVRHGQPFTDRLLFHDMFKRAFTHVHDTNDGDDTSFRFYIWQLGYATFPWSGLVPAGLVWWLRRREDHDEKSDASAFLVTWFIFAFGLFSLMLTKFHHYILPAIPPAAMLTGVLLDGLFDRSLHGEYVVDGGGDGGGDGTRVTRASIALYGAGFLAGMVGLIWGGTRVAAFFVAAPGAARSVPSVLLGAGVVVLGLAALVVTANVFDRVLSDPPVEDEPLSQKALRPSAYRGERAAPARAPDPYRRRFEIVLLGAAGVAASVLVLAVGHDLFTNVDGVPSQIRLMHLVTYNYRRPWPPSLDFTPTLWAFTAVSAVLCFALILARVRRHVVVALITLGVVFGGWGLDVYFMKISPHWGQRETTLAYYQAARDLPGPLVAYQMNWKGENFYTGNHVPAFVSSGKKFTDFMTEEKKKGVKTFYFVTEHGRTGTLSNEIGTTKEFKTLTTAELDNKFVLVRARFE